MSQTTTTRGTSPAGVLRLLAASINAWRGSMSPLDWLFKQTTFFFALMVAGAVIFIIIEMAMNSSLTFQKFGWSFVSRSAWNPVRDDFGSLPFVYGTAVSSILALIIAVPVSVGVGVFLVETAPKKLATPISFVVQLLAAIPSVVYGLWGIFVLAPLLRDRIYPAIQSKFGYLPIFRGNPNGLGLLTAGIILSIMVVPIVTAVTTDVMRAAPEAQREASLALGATKWEATLIVLQNARSGITGAIILGLGRAIGETMAVTMVIGNRPEISLSIFDPSYTIASTIANEFSEATTEIYKSALVELGLTLFVITFVINIAARLLVWAATRGQGKAADA